MNKVTTMEYSHKNLTFINNPVKHSTIDVLKICKFK